MKRKIQQLNKSIRFRHFSGKAYAVFNSLHKQISIGKTCATAADNSLLKSNQSNKLAENKAYIALLPDNEDEENCISIDMLISELIAAIQPQKAAASSYFATSKNNYHKPQRGSTFIHLNKRWSSFLFTQEND